MEYNGGVSCKKTILHIDNIGSDNFFYQNYIHNLIRFHIPLFFIKFKNAINPLDNIRRMITRLL